MEKALHIDLDGVKVKDAPNGLTAGTVKAGQLHAGEAYKFDDGKGNVEYVGEDRQGHTFDIRHKGGFKEGKEESVIASAEGAMSNEIAMAKVLPATPSGGHAVLKAGFGIAESDSTITAAHGEATAYDAKGRQVGATESVDVGTLKDGKTIIIRNEGDPGVADAGSAYLADQAAHAATEAMQQARRVQPKTTSLKA
ncbi:MAG: hypothetical protein JO126_00295 [Alphaproteobacteria bacterium]|nr:hypothetical protein [Alphaproteobacteria bacterium]